MCERCNTDETPTVSVNVLRNFVRSTPIVGSGGLSQSIISFSESEAIDVCETCAESFVDCSACSEQFEEDAIHEGLCPACFADAPRCEDCECLILDGSGIDGHCETCYSDNYFTCEDCEEVHHNDNANTVRRHRYSYARTSAERIVCDSCAQDYDQCTDCGESFHSPDMMSLSGGEYLCNSCYEDGWFTCEGCDNILNNDEYGSNGHCTSCEDDRESERGPILEYHDDYDLEFFGNPKDGVYYGIEIETDDSHDRSDAAYSVLDSLGTDFAVCMEDGSLSDSHGFEIISAPATLDEHYKRWPKLFANKPRGMRSQETHCCGMHVHISRKPLSALTIGKMLVFINSPSNRSFTEAIAGRSEVHFCRRKSDKKLTDGKRRSHDHYDALNLEKSETVELRIFKGTLNPRSFFKNLEFAAALVSFAKNTGIRNLAWQDMIAHINRHKKVYPNLVSWLRDKDYLPKPNPVKVKAVASA